jgi:exodeoxyribonuclease VII small subunit
MPDEQTTDRHTATDEPDGEITHDVTDSPATGRDPADDQPAKHARSAPTVPEDPHSYEQAREELLDVVHRLEAGGTTLEESLALWERGERLAALCQQWLDGARARLAAAMPDDEDGGTGPD